MLARQSPIYLLLTAVTFPPFLVSLLGGTGVPPGTRPETCKRCKGSGVVSTACLFSLFTFGYMHVSYYIMLGPFYLYFQ